MAHRPEKREEIRSSWARGSDAEPVPGVPHLPRNRDTKPDGENTIQRNHPRSQDIRQLPSRPGHRRQTTNFVKLWVMTRAALRLTVKNVWDFEEMMRRGLGPTASQLQIARSEIERIREIASQIERQ